MAQQYPYGGQQPYQYPTPQPPLYPQHQGGSRPASPYQQPVHPYNGQGYPQPPPRTPSPYQQPQPQQMYLAQGYPPSQQYSFFQPQSHPQPSFQISQAYPTQAYPAAQQGYQYATAPSPQLQTPQQNQPYTLLFQPTSQKHTHSLSMQVSDTPLFLIHYNRPLIASSKPEISITTPSGQQMATAQWHTWSDKIDLVFPSQGRQITYKDNVELPAGSLGRIFWTMSHGNAKEANVRCADRTGATIVTIVLHDKLRSGKIEFWRSGLEKDVFEQLVVNAVAEIEDLRRKMESANTVNPGIYAGAAVAAGMN
ncbi:hypothetical protein H2200_003005 [Cladophialophora chaetospira]|uniref:Uncharacterized protein n=1 Tax=Cladophialophora chaetospira TaxID=386627 RepID=A0AA38XGL8_9EURO|nr:hypothetical protein H2200_003005 [Cladophialophora chaetospira]